MNRREFFKAMAMAAAGVAVDWERLFWVKKKTIFIPPPPVIAILESTAYGRLDYVAPAPPEWIWKWMEEIEKQLTEATGVTRGMLIRTPTRSWVPPMETPWTGVHSSKVWE